MARAIDADALREKFADILNKTFIDDYAKGFVAGLCAALNMPPLTLPNEPLTLDELREMDGEPAWWDDGDGSCWGIISVDSAGMWGGIPFLRGRWRQVNFEYNIEERKMRIYRRPPEGEEAHRDEMQRL